MIVAKVKWPKYAAGNPMNIVFSANESVHVESDTYRQAGNDYLIERLSTHPSWA